MEHVLKIEIENIRQSPYQGRLLEFGITKKEELDNPMSRLVRNIRENGLMTPVMVRAVEGGYELIDGHRRLEACRLLGYKTIDAIVKEADDRTAQVMSLVSNLQRQDLYYIERALAFRKILDAGIFKDQKELSRAIGKDPTYVGDLLNTLNLDKRIIEDLLKNRTTNDVRLLRAIRRAGKTDSEGYSDEQWKLYRRFVDEKLSRKELLKIVSGNQGKTPDVVTVDFKPRRIEIKLSHKVPLQQRKVLEDMIRDKIGEMLSKYR